MRVDPLVRWLRETSPTLHRLLRPLWRSARRTLGVEEQYWTQRKHFNYYVEVVRLCRAYEPGGGHVIDVGAGPTHLLHRLDWFAHRVALDRFYFPARRGIDVVQADFLVYQPDRRFDLVLCLQVLEHLEDPARFARRLFAMGRTVIITVPYRWAAGLYPPHVQDPVDEAKLRSWTERAPLETRVVADGSRERLIAVYREEGGP